MKKFIRMITMLLVLITASMSAYAAQLQTPVVPGQTEADVRSILGEPDRQDVNVYSEKVFSYSNRGMSVVFFSKSGLVAGLTLGIGYTGKIAGDVDMAFTKDRVIQVLGAGEPIPDEDSSDSEAYAWDFGAAGALFHFHNTNGSILYVEVSS